MMRLAHSASGTGLASTQRQLVSTAWRTVTGRSSSSGMATTLEANTGAAISAPSISHASNSQWSRASMTWRAKSSGVVMGVGENAVMTAADVTTQPVPASASSRPKRTSLLSPERQTDTTVVRPGLWPCSSARLMAYRPVATSGATSRNPEKAPASSQNRWWANTKAATATSAATSPCSRPGQGARSMSRHAKPSHCSGSIRLTLRTSGSGAVCCIQ